MTKPYVRPAVKRFHLPAFRLRKATVMPINMNLQASSNRRILENTPTLRALYEFLARPLP